jgi:hypothetical protein
MADAAGGRRRRRGLKPRGWAGTSPPARPWRAPVRKGTVCAALAFRSCGLGVPRRSRNAAPWSVCSDIALRDRTRR